MEIILKMRPAKDYQFHSSANEEHRAYVKSINVCSKVLLMHGLQQQGIIDP